jgi:hypothetical protein
VNTVISFLNKLLSQAALKHTSKILAGHSSKLKNATQKLQFGFVILSPSDCKAGQPTTTPRTPAS